MDDSTVDGRARATATSSMQRVHCTGACSEAGPAYTYLRHVRSHVRVPGNELADRLAGVGGSLEQSTQSVAAGVASAAARARRPRGQGGSRVRKRRAPRYV